VCKDPAVMRIRPYGPNDSVSVTELSLRAWEPVFASLRVVLGSSIFERLHTDWKIDQSNAVTAVLADSNVQTWVAEQDGRVVGFTSRGSTKNERWARSSCSRSTLRRNGLGRDFLSLCTPSIR